MTARRPDSPAGGPEKSPHRLFICYRRKDNPDFVGHIHTWFAWRFAHVFMDFAGTPGGAEWKATIRDEVRRCDAMLVIIGPDWMKEIKDNPYNKKKHDWVRSELEQALRQQKVIVPVCIKGAKMPKAEDLPRGIDGLVGRQAINLNPGEGFTEAIEREIESLSNQLRGKVPHEAAIETLEALPPAAGLALGYYVNFVRPTVSQLAAGAAVTSAAGPLGDDERRRVRLQIVIPARAALANDDTAMKRLPAAVGETFGVAIPNRDRPLPLPGLRHPDGIRLIDVPRTIGVLERWVQRRLTKARLDQTAEARPLKQRRLTKARLGQTTEEAGRVERRQLGDFESILRWWIDENDDAFQERVEVLRYPADRSKLAWLVEAWPDLTKGDAAP